jgi:hypothetical protein
MVVESGSCGWRNGGENGEAVIDYGNGAGEEI